MLSKNLLIILIIILYLIYTDIINLDIFKNNYIYNYIFNNILEDNLNHSEDEEDLDASEDTTKLINNLHAELVSKNNKIYLDISIDDKLTERIIFELYTDKVPITCNNFIELCKNKAYKDNKFHRLVSNFCIQGGDITKFDGTGGISIYGPKFDDENFSVSHDSCGILSMANSGPNTNNSQFFITLNSTSHLDGKHVAFGKCIKGLDFIKNLNNLKSDNEVPINNIVITDCGIN